MPSRTYKPSQQTKTKILQKATELFNEHGTAVVSLNSLAEVLGISTGNLQYHYRSKEEIIRAIFEVMFNDWNAVYQEIYAESFSVDTFRRALRLNFSLFWKYRFFYR
ncbi:MAG: TetR/AcrR family transcriptional regulator, partial [Chloroflexota bacterium]